MGMALFSANPSETNTIVAYIKDQHEHHSKKHFSLNIEPS